MVRAAPAEGDSHHSKPSPSASSEGDSLHPGMVRAASTERDSHHSMPSPSASSEGDSLHLGHGPSSPGGWGQSPFQAESERLAGRGQSSSGAWSERLRRMGTVTISSRVRALRRKGTVFSGRAPWEAGRAGLLEVGRTRRPLSGRRLDRERDRCARPGASTLASHPRREGDFSCAAWAKPGCESRTSLRPK